MRRTCEGVLVCHEHNHPHILMLQIANAFFKLWVPLCLSSSPRVTVSLSIPFPPTIELLARAHEADTPKIQLISNRPGDYLPPHLSETDGFKQRLNERLAPVGSQFSGEGVNDGEWVIGDTLAQWWRPNFETFMYPFLPAHVTRPKECKKLYFIELPKSSMCIESRFQFCCPSSLPFFFLSPCLNPPQ